MLIITEEEVRQLLPMKECIDVLDSAFREWDAGTVSNVARYRMPLVKGTHQLMAAASHDIGATGLKTYVTGTKGGSQMVVLLFDAETGQPLAMLSANALGQIRTGAASGLATRYMAQEKARSVGIIGSGYQAQTQLEAICAVRNIRRALVYSRSSEHRESFAKEMSARLGLEVAAVDSSDSAVAGVDVVCAITSSRDPVFDGDSIKPGVHVNAAGSNHWMRRELDEATIKRSDLIVCDDVEDARIECGELIWAAERRVFRWQSAQNLKDIVAGRVSGRPSTDAITLFESQGLAIEDVAAGMHVYRKALEKGIGRRIDI